MKKRLCIALISPSKELISILDSIGLWYEVEPRLPLSPENYSLLILEKNSAISSHQNEIQQFLDEDGYLLNISSDPKLFDSQFRNRKVTRLINRNNIAGFNRVPYLDIYSKVALSNNSELFNGLVDINTTNSTNNVALIGFNLSSLFSSKKGYQRKRFYSPVGENPDEIVSTIHRDAICDLIEVTIQHLHIKQGIPFIKKWHSPTKNPVFLFRIDSDYGTQSSLQKIYDLLDKHKLKATWFLHVFAHKNWLSKFKQFQHQELALHGYKHGYSSSPKKIKRNIEVGLKDLEKANINVDGFCAPYAIWNDGLKSALSTFDFLYTSEFTRAYDSLPFFDDKEHLQIPIHPICTGSFSRIRYSETNIQNYFNFILNQKLQLWKPIVFYHHPMQYAFDIFDDIFSKVNSQKLTNLTFTEYAQFWKKRNATKVECTFDGNSVSLNANNKDCLFYIANSFDGFGLEKPNTKIDSTQITSTFKYHTTSIPSVNEIEELSVNKLQLLKTSLIDWKNRNRL